MIEIAVYALVALVAYVASAGPGLPRQRNPGLLNLLWAATGVLVLSVIYSPFLAFSAVRGAQLLVVAGLAHVTARYASPKHLALLLQCFTMVVGLSVLLGLFIPFERIGAASSRFSWLQVHPVVAGTYLALAVLFLVCHLGRRADGIDAPAWPRAVQWTLLIVCTCGLVATQTRGAIAAAAVGCFVALWSRNPPSRRMDLLVGATIVIALLSLVGGDVLLEFLQRGESAERIATLNSRTELWSRMLSLWSQQPLFGYGLGASRGLLFDETGLGGAHNALVNVLLDAGVAGLGIWVVFLTALIRYLLILRYNSRTRVIASTLLGATSLLLVNGLTVEFLVVPATIASTWLFMIVAWTLVLIRDDSD